MESSPNNNKPTQHKFQSSVDTSRPFRSVKEAVAVFGERILLGGAYVSPARAEITHRRSSSWNYKLSSTPSPRSPTVAETTPKSQNDSATVMEALKKVEAELEETKAELRALKEREKETEVAVAALNAELHKNMSRLAAAEAAAAAASGGREEERKRELRKRMEKNTTLAQILSLGLAQNENENENENESDQYYFGRKNMNAKKIKPIVPLVGDLLSSLRKASRSSSATSLHNPLYSAPAAQLFH